MYVCIRWGDFQHTLSECWACILLGVCRQMLVHEDTKDKLPRGECLYGAYSGSLQEFFPREIFDIKLTLGNCISNPKEPHFHGP
jgi:hypothetical protein